MISCSVRENFIAEASLENSKCEILDSYVKNRIKIKLLNISGNGEKIIDDVIIPWPEKFLPNHIYYNVEESFLEMRSENNIAKISLKLMDNLLEDIGKYQHDSLTKMYDSWTENPQNEQNSLLKAIRKLINTENITASHLKSLQGAISEYENDRNSVKFRLCNSEQKKLLALIMNKDIELLLNLVQKQIIGPDVAVDLIDYLIDKNRWDILQNFIKNCSLFPDDAILKVLKICSSKSCQNYDKILQEVLKKPINCNFVSKITRNGLDANDGFILMKKLFSLISNSDDRKIIEKSVEIASLLIDRFSKELSLDSCQIESLKTTMEAVGDMASVLRTFVDLASRIEARKKIASLSQLENTSDYAILSMILVPK